MSGFFATVFLSITIQDLDTSSVFHLLYLFIKLDEYSYLFQSLVDYAFSINLVYEPVVLSLNILVTVCIGSRVSLADDYTVL